LAVSSEDVETYCKLELLGKAIVSNRQKRISIAEGNGFPYCIRAAVHLTRQLAYMNDLVSIGVVADSKSDHVYDRLRAVLTTYLETPCKKHNVNPEISCYPKQRLTVSFRPGRNIIMWSLEIPESLEIQISRVLKKKHPKLRSIDSEDETMEVASRMFKTSKESIVRKSVGLLENESWFNDFCIRLRNNIDLSAQSLATAK